MARAARATRTAKRAMAWKRAMVRAARAMATATRVAGDEEGKGASIGHPRRKTRAIKGGRSAVVMTGWPKAGQDPDDPAATGSPKRDLCVCVLTCPPGW